MINQHNQKDFDKNIICVQCGNRMLKEDHKAFRKEVISALEQNRDIDYYDVVSTFKKLDAIQKEYQDAAQKIVKIV